MALTPEDVLNKTFTQTQFRRGYDEREVDDFLDDIVAEMRRMTKESDELRGELNTVREGKGMAPTFSQADVDASAKDLEELRAKNATLAARVSELEGTRSELTARLGEYEGKSGDTESRNADLQGRVGQLEHRNGELERQSSELQTRATDAEKRGTV
ncbi:MAG: DivIVA domain-containing protein, partial [Phycicoccus sp.]